MLGVGFLKRLLLCLFCHVDVVLLSFVLEQMFSWGFPDSSAGKESVCNAGDPSSVSGSGRSPGEGTGYLLQHSWTSLVAQAVKNQPAIQETWVESLDWEDLLEEGMATHSSILAWRIPWTRGAWRATAKSQT